MVLCLASSVFLSKLKNSQASATSLTLDSNPHGAFIVSGPNSTLGSNDRPPDPTRTGSLRRRKSRPKHANHGVCGPSPVSQLDACSEVPAAFGHAGLSVLHCRHFGFRFLTPRRSTRLDAFGLRLAGHLADTFERGEGLAGIDGIKLIRVAAFDFSESTTAFLPVLKSALTRRGLPLRLYVDNGANYRSHQLAVVCAKLGIALRRRALRLCNAREHRARPAGAESREIGMPELTLELRAAAESDDVEAIDVLIKAGADPNAKNDAGNTAPHAAAYRGSVGAIRALLAAGADRNARNVYGATALDIAMREGRDYAARALRDA